MRLLFDARVLQPQFPGIGRYATNLLRALSRLEPALELVLLTESSATRLPLPRTRWLSVAPIRHPLSQFQLPWLSRNLQIDLFHAPYYLYPFLTSLPTVVTIHDLIPLQHPRMLSSRWAQRLYKPLHRLAVRSADAVLTDSAAAKEAIRAHLDVDSEMIEVVPLAPDPFFTTDPALTRDDFFFALFSEKPHKNSARLLRAYARTDPSTHRVALHAAGLDAEQWHPFGEMAEQLGVAERVVPLGRLTDEALRDQYRRCLAFIFPSYEEGFGLPILEAMACGAPLLVADRAPMSELATDAALTVDPFDDAAIASALERLIGEPAHRATLSTHAHRRASMFTWEQSARRTLTVYARVLERADSRNG